MFQEPAMRTRAWNYSVAKRILSSLCIHEYAYSVGLHIMDRKVETGFKCHKNISNSTFTIYLYDSLKHSLLALLPRYYEGFAFGACPTFAFYYFAVVRELVIKHELA